MPPFLYFTKRWHPLFSAALTVHRSADRQTVSLGISPWQGDPAGRDDRPTHANGRRYDDQSVCGSRGCGAGPGSWRAASACKRRPGGTVPGLAGRDLSALRYPAIAAFASGCGRGISRVLLGALPFTAHSARVFLNARMRFDCCRFNSRGISTIATIRIPNLYSSERR